MKTLLAIVNEPKESKGFLLYVAGMAINLSAQVKILNVHTPVNYPMGVIDSSGLGTLEMKRNQENIVNESKKILTKYVEAITEKMSKNMFVEVISYIGFAAEKADQLVSDKEADMLVLEGQEDDGFWLQTSSNIDIIEKVNCPVWIIPKGAIFKPFTNIIYATDYNEEDITSLKKLIKSFPHYSPNITALHITDSTDFEERVKKEEFIETLQKQTAYKQLSFKVAYKSKEDDLTELLNDFALKNEADLLILLKENKSFFKRIFNTSQTKELLKITVLPVLIYHEK
jgi:hypothetical protein